jgi:hypothetical protein
MLTFALFLIFFILGIAIAVFVQLMRTANRAGKSVRKWLKSTP